MSDLSTRITDKIINWPLTTDDCWLWKGAFSYNTPKIGKNCTSISAATEIFLLINTGGLTNGKHNLCKNVACVNPFHRDPHYKSRDKESRKKRKNIIPFPVSRNVCWKAGHPIKGHNILINKYPMGRIVERCRICHYKYQMEYHGRDYTKIIEKLKMELGINN